MLIAVSTQGLEATLVALGQNAEQIPFATARALTVSAHAVNRDIQTRMRADIQGGPTPYTLRALEVEAANKANLTATVRLKDPSKTQGTPYERTLGHLFHGGVRPFKRLESMLAARGLVPTGRQLAPGKALALDSRGNAKQAEIREMLGVLTAYRRNLLVLQAPNRKRKTEREIGYFVVFPGSVSAGHLHPGIYKRKEERSGRGRSSVVFCKFLFVTPPSYRRVFNLDEIAKTSVSTTWPAAFRDSFAKSIATAK